MWGADYFSIRGLIELVGLSAETVKKVSALYTGNQRQAVVRKLHAMYFVPSEHLDALRRAAETGSVRRGEIEDFRSFVIESEPEMREAISAIDRVIQSDTTTLSLKEKSFLEQETRQKVSIREQLAQLFYLPRDDYLSRWEQDELRDLVSSIERMNALLEKIESSIRKPG